MRKSFARKKWSFCFSSVFKEPIGCNWRFFNGIIAWVMIERSFEVYCLVSKTLVKKQQENAKVDPIVKRDLIRGHHTSFSRLFISVNSKLVFAAFYDPGLRIASAGSKSNDSSDLRVGFSSPYFRQRLSFAFKHVLPELIISNLCDCNHYDEVKTMIFVGIRFPYAKPERSNA